MSLGLTVNGAMADSIATLLNSLQRAKTMKPVIFSAALLMAALSSLASAEEVEITLKHNLDGYLSGYCLDIKGGGPDVDPANGLQSHTCYSYRGDLGTDQIFETEKFADNQLYMPEFDVCGTLTAIEQGATLSLAECSGSAEQSITFGNDGTLRPTADTSLCLTAGLATERGRGGTSDHQIKSLTLIACSEDRQIFQQWRTRTQAD